MELGSKFCLPAKSMLLMILLHCFSDLFLYAIKMYMKSNISTDYPHKEPANVVVKDKEWFRLPHWFLFLPSSLELLLIKFLVTTIYLHLTHWTLKTTTKQQFKHSIVLKKTTTTKYEEYSEIYLSEGLLQDRYEADLLIMYTGNK